MFAAESILLEVQRRVDMRNGEIIERIFRELRPKFCGCCEMLHEHCCCDEHPRSWIDEEFTRMAEEQEALLHERIHMQFCEDCNRSISRCVCNLMPTATEVAAISNKMAAIGDSTNNVGPMVGGWAIYND